jgi:ribonuclease HII
MNLYSEEIRLVSEEVSLIAGVDEVGRGCLAGPVFAAAVILPRDLKIPYLNDSKQLTPPLRDSLNEKITQQAIAFHVARVEADEIDRINILWASMKAMKLAVMGLKISPEYLLVDGNRMIESELPQLAIVSGDARCASIAAASIVAKVARDRFMTEQEQVFPQFSFSKHKGYGTAEHLQELARNGPTVLHRRSFAPVSQILSFPV